MSSAEPTPPADLPPGRILAVDDNESIRDFYRHFFKLEGLPVEIIASPHAALERFQSAPQDYTLLLTDCEMPGMNGKELARRIRQMRADLPTIVFSTSVTVLGPQPFLSSGFNFALPKPVALVQLRDAIRSAIAVSPPAPPAP